MITVEAVLSDLEKIEKDPELTDLQKYFASLKLVMKFLSTMRSNQLLPESEKVRLYEEKKKRDAEREARKGKKETK